MHMRRFDFVAAYLQGELLEGETIEWVYGHADASSVRELTRRFYADPRARTQQQQQQQQQHSAERREMAIPPHLMDLND